MKKSLTKVKPSTYKRRITVYTKQHGTISDVEREALRFLTPGELTKLEAGERVRPKSARGVPKVSETVYQKRLKTLEAKGLKSATTAGLARFQTPGQIEKALKEAAARDARRFEEARKLERRNRERDPEKTIWDPESGEAGNFTPVNFRGLPYMQVKDGIYEPGNYSHEKGSFIYNNQSLGAVSTIVNTNAMMWNSIDGTDHSALSFIKSALSMFFSDILLNPEIKGRLKEGDDRWFVYKSEWEQYVNTGIVTEHRNDNK